MIETELKAVVPDLEGARRQAELQGAKLTFSGRLEDRRYDRPDRSLAAVDHVLRLRAYRKGSSLVSASVDWKGPSSMTGSYKEREEITAHISGDPVLLGNILERLGFIVTMQIDREIWQYELRGAVVRFERYPRMDDLVEVEGSPGVIEEAIAALGLPRDSFSTERLLDFVQRYEARTGSVAALSDAELHGEVRYDVSNA
jgi:adenylate cyclase class IV